MFSKAADTDAATVVETASSESFLQLSVPETPFDRGKRFIVTVLEASGYKGWIGVKHVLDAKRDSGVIEPRLPIATAVFTGRDGNDIFLFAVLRLDILTTVFRKTRYLRSSRRR